MQRGEPGKEPGLLGPLRTEPQNQKGAGLGAEDKASQEVSLSHCSTPEDSWGYTQHCPPSDACLLPCQVAKDHQALSWATVLLAAILGLHCGLGKTTQGRGGGVCA